MSQPVRSAPAAAAAAAAAVADDQRFIDEIAEDIDEELGTAHHLANSVRLLAPADQALRLLPSREEQKAQTLQCYKDIDFLLELSIERGGMPFNLHAAANVANLYALHYNGSASSSGQLHTANRAEVIRQLVKPEAEYIVSK